MQIIDAQVHIWGSGKPSDHHRQTSIYTAEELIKEMDAAGVNGAVLHPPSWDNGSNEMAVEAARKYPDRFCILGWFPLNQPEERKRIETWKQPPGMLGLRWSLTRPEQVNWHKDGTMDWLWPAAEQAGTPIATMAWRFLPLFKQIAERYPNLKLMRCVRWRNVRMWPSRRQARRAIPPRPIHSAISTTGCTASSMRTGRSGSSGAPISHACRAAIVSA
jgi:predicted TIM-barrel fold metal-dependent hydrolase